MNKKNILFLLVSVFSLTNCFSQTGSLSALFQGTIVQGSTSNSVLIKIKPNQTFSGQITNVQFTVQVPNTVVPQPTVTIKSNPLSNYIPTGNYLTQVVNEGGFYTYLFAVTTLGSPVYSFTNGVEVNALELQFAGASVTSTVRLAHLPSGGSTLQLAFYTEISGNENTNYTNTFYGPGAVNGGTYESYSYVPIANIILPVSFTSFAVVKNNDDALLQWLVDNESATTAAYEIERSIDGIAFEKIISVAAKNNNLITNNYSYTDKGLLTIKTNGIVYYRIKQIDVDGKFVYTDIKNIRLSNNDVDISIFPNPVTTVTTLKIQSTTVTKATMTISTIDGKILAQFNLVLQNGVTYNKIDFSKYLKGTYLIKVASSNVNNIIKVVKQ